MALSGMDVEAILAVASQLSDQASRLEQSVGSVDRLVGQAAGVWRGPDLDQFKQRWEVQYRRTGQLTASDLRDLADLARRNAEAQRQTSSTLDGGGGGGASGGSGGSSGSGSGSGSGSDGTDFTDSAWFKDGKILNTLLNLPTKLGTLLPLVDRLAVLASKVPLEDVGGLLGKAGWLARGATEVDDLAKAFSVPSNWGNIGAEASKLLRASELGMVSEGGAGLVGKIAPLLAEGGSLSSTLSVAGKVLGPVGAVFSAANTYSDFQQGNYGRGAYDGVMTVASIAACVPIPPINAIGAGVAGAMALGELAYDHIPFVHDAVDTGVKAIENGAKAVGNFLGSINPFHW